MNYFSFEYNSEILNIKKNNYKKKLNFEINHFKYEYKTFFLDNKITVVIGRPIINNTVNFDKVLEFTTSNENIKKINGEFLIIEFDLNIKKLKIINDRFASVQFYYFVEKGKFFGSTNYIQIAKKLKIKKKFKIDEYKIFEFLKFQRIFNGNYDKLSKVLMSYNKLEFKKNKLTIEEYWNPKFNIENKNLDWFAHRLNFLIDQSIERKFSGNEKRLVFFLSGGIDSRSFLSKIHTKIKTESVTFAPSLNNEAKIAKEVSDALNVKNSFFSLGADAYKAHYKKMSLLSYGNSSFDHSIFAAIKKVFFNKFDISSSGWGIDIYFQGYYIPLIKKKIFNYFPTFFYKLDKSIFEKTTVKFFINNLPYRNKLKNLSKLFNKNYKTKFDKILKKQINQVCNKSKSVANNPVDAYNHMVVNDIFRHYSFANLQSMSYCKKNTCIMFDNDLLEFYYTIPYKFLINKKLYKHYVTKFINNKISNIKTGNENIKYSLSPLRKTILWYFDKILIKFKLRKKTIFYNPLSERSWPSRSEVLKNKKMNKVIAEFKKNNFFSRLKSFNNNALDNFLKNTETKPDWYSASTLLYLVTLNEVFKSIYKK